MAWRRKEEKGRAESRKEGWVKIIYHNDNERLWITVNLIEKIMYLYNEWEIGGLLWDRKTTIPDFALDNKNNFIEWIDKEIGL